MMAKKVAPLMIFPKTYKSMAKRGASTMGGDTGSSAGDASQKEGL
jgi:hypothetical protein